MRKLLVIYNTIGFPSVDKFRVFVREACTRGVDFFEIGLPPRIAKYDGPAIRRSYAHIRNTGIDVWKVLEETRLDSSVPVIALAYLEEWIERLDYFLEKLSRSGIEYALFPDLLIDYVDLFEDVVEKVEDYGLESVLFVSPSMPDSLIARVSRMSKPFIYYGIRPATGIPLPVEPSVLIKRVRPLINNTLIAGFGLSLRDIPRVVEAGADGVAIGTAIVESLEKDGVESALKLVEAARGVLDGL